MTALVEGDRIGPYRIIRLLGAGGMGVVYEARQEPLNRRVALKTLHAQYVADQDLAARFFNEAKVLSCLEHPSIVQVCDFGHTPSGTAYLVMEYLRGQSLSERLQSQGGSLPWVAALQLGWQVAEVLTIVHAQGVIHRDLKPDNLMLVADPVAPGGERVKVLDFGIAKLLNKTERGGIRTNTQAVMGTPMYMSPEQCAGAGGVDGKSDVYSLGCVLYLILSGRPPFIAEGAGQLIGMHLYAEPPALAALAEQVPPAVIALVHWMLTKDKRLRPSMAETVEALGLLLATLSGVGLALPPRPLRVARADSTLPLLARKESTTLGQSSGQQRKRKSGWRQLLFASAAGLLLVAIISTSWRSHAREKLGPKPAAVAASVSVPAAPVANYPARVPAAAEMVRWEVSTIPPGAAVLDDQGNQLGNTPWTQEFPARAGTVKLSLRSDGYREEVLALVGDADASQQLKLTRIPQSKSVRAKLPANPPSHRPTSKSTPEITYEN